MRIVRSVTFSGTYFILPQERPELMAWCDEHQVQVHESHEDTGGVTLFYFTVTDSTGIFALRWL